MILKVVSAVGVAILKRYSLHWIDDSVIGLSLLLLRAWSNNWQDSYVSYCWKNY